MMFINYSNNSLYFIACTNFGMTHSGCFFFKMTWLCIKKTRNIWLRRVVKSLVNFRTFGKNNTSGSCAVV